MRRAIRHDDQTPDRRHGPDGRETRSIGCSSPVPSGVTRKTPAASRPPTTNRKRTRRDTGDHRVADGADGAGHGVGGRRAGGRACSDRSVTRRCSARAGRRNGKHCSSTGKSLKGNHQAEADVAELPIAPGARRVTLAVDEIDVRPRSSSGSSSSCVRQPRSVEHDVLIHDGSSADSTGRLQAATSLDTHTHTHTTTTRRLRRGRAATAPRVHRSTCPAHCPEAPRTIADTLQRLRRRQLTCR